MLANVRAQELGPAKVGDLELSGPFLRRVVTRVVRTSFERDVRVVVEDAQPAATNTAPKDATPANTAPSKAPPPPSSSSTAVEGADHGALIWALVGAFALVVAGFVVARARKGAGA